MAAPDRAYFDFIVVGGGTAGNTVTGRLAENPNVTVLVVEAGIGNPHQVDDITTPALALDLHDSQYDWLYKTTMVNATITSALRSPIPVARL